MSIYRMVIDSQSYSNVRKVFGSLSGKANIDFDAQNYDIFCQKNGLTGEGVNNQPSYHTVDNSGNFIVHTPSRGRILRQLKNGDVEITFPGGSENCAAEIFEKCRVKAAMKHGETRLFQYGTKEFMSMKKEVMDIRY